MIKLLKDIFTIKTVWIDLGEGRWAVRRRLHPVMRMMLLCAVIAMAGLAYFAFSDAEEMHDELDVTTAAPSEEPSEPAAPDDAEAVPSPDEAKDEPSADAEEESPSAEPEVSTEPAVIEEPDDKGDDAPSEEPKTVIEAPRRPERKGRGRRRNAQPADSVPYDGLYREPTSEDEAAASAANPQAKSEFRIVIRKNDYTLDVFDGREFVKSYDIAVGRNPGNKQRVGDNRTPTGKFTVRSIENSSDWSHDFGDGKGMIKNAYGPWFIRLNTGRWKGIGIHGTHAPESIGTMATEGCIRLNNSDLRELKRNYVFRGMKVEIKE